LADEGTPAATTLLGREAEREAVVSHVRTLRSSEPSGFVTLTGLPGVGRSAVAAAAASELTASGAVGDVVVIPLQRVSDPLAAVDATLAQLPGGGLSTSLAEAMWEAYDGMALLVVLEDVDVLEGLAEVIEELATGYPAATVVCTCVRPTREPGERVVRLASFPVPGDDAPADHPALVLFARRARATGVVVDLDDARTRAEVAAICRHADGHPGTIELAAARAGEVPLAAMVRMLGNRLGADSALEWSYELLSKEAQELLPQMSVFEGAFLLDSLAAVADHDPTSGDLAADVLELVDAHLLRIDTGGTGEPRFELPPLVRAFASRLLASAGNAVEVRDRHARYFHDRGRAGGEVVRREWPDMAAALDHEMHMGRIDDALAAAIALAPEVQEAPGVVASLEGRINEMLASGDQVPRKLRAQALMWSTRTFPDGESADMQRFGIWTAQRLAEATSLARESGDGDALLSALERTVTSLRITLDLQSAVSAAYEGVELARRLDDQPALSRFECWVSMAELSTGNAAEAARLATSSLVRGREQDDPVSVTAAAHLLLTLPPELQPTLDPPLPTLEELLDQCERWEQPFTGMTVLAALTHESCSRGDASEAARWVWRLLMIGANRQRTEPMATLAGIALLMSVALVVDEYDDAARLREAARPLELFIPYSLSPRALQDYLRDAALLDDTLPGDRRQALAVEVAEAGMGGINRWAQAAARRYAGHRPPSNATSSRPTPELTPRERDVLVAITTGRTNREIAEQLGMSAKTVMHHSVAIYRKLGVRGRAGATAWAYEHGLATEG
jgi:DNA-binding NarL/FixJ family response regulator/predicted ATPase